MRFVFLATFLIIGVRLLPAQIAGDAPMPISQSAGDDVDEATIARIKDQPLAMQWTISYLQGVSQSELQQAYRDLKAPGTAYGFGVELGKYFDPMPLFIGGEIGVMWFPSNDRSISPTSRRTYQVNTSNFVIPIMGTVRFQPSLDNWVYPYAEFVAGVNIHSSDVTVRTIIDSDTTSNSEGSGDFNWNYGIGLGAAFKVADVITLPNTLQRTLIDVRFRYITGSSLEVSYADLRDDTSLDYEIRGRKVFRPSVLTFRLGITFQL
ncbi:MAG: porin family protein [Candidatus Kapabacteria bacterium]|nr:porin family protein [Candidatus Kapabacteria bacterium]